MLIPKHGILNYLGGKRIVVCVKLGDTASEKKMETDNVEQKQEMLEEY